jgi:hypothetical protein
MSDSDRSHRRNQIVLALNALLLITCGIVMIFGYGRPTNWIILLVLVANIATLTSIVRSRPPSS